MQNPNSAIERVKNHLAYKLGQAMIEYNKNGGGYCHLFKKLYEIKKQHKKEQKIYQQTIQVFPQLKYPNLETCSDYEQALRYKFHLSYMLGEVLIKAGKTWYKGSGFKLKNDIKKAKKEFQIFKEILTEIKELNGKALKAIKDNQQFFLKEFPRIKNILKIHKNYQPILDNIFHNFDYFIQNFDLIEEWLLSNDFNERYKKGNHPYPSLLDPKKLNDENEKINYKNIPAELAWEINLPLPSKYKFIIISHHHTGTYALRVFLQETCNTLISGHFIWSENVIQKYMYAYNDLLNFQDKQNVVLLLKDYHREFFEKYISLIQKNTKVLILTRDPIEILRSILNYGYVEKFALTEDTDLNKISFLKYYAGQPDNYYVLKDHYKPEFRGIFITNKIINKIKKYINIEPYYIHTKDLASENILTTMFKISKEFNISFRESPILYVQMEGVMNRLFPMSLILKKYNINLEIIHELTYTNKQVVCEINIENKLFKSNFKVVSKDLLQNKREIIVYVRKFIDKLNKKLNLEYEKRTNEIKCIEYFRTIKSEALLLRKILDEELSHIKKHRPDIVASWKYYQEFEKMCSELD
ncbi:DUF2972 domain-containing protein [Campylobacter novaezeelandiae]|uniref:DUF2972 domain-containing protein n=1 Tax=Campylobacter novaezeelandiae TaxID=2267891 RepID=UPI001C1E5CEC|nr:DUF2972 domain-containing protein [Campylobacter novaezeelandiae]QWU79709.1 DUF2972 domain-containing protein [Campylobacter novaezeelandiae]